MGERDRLTAMSQGREVFEVNLNAKHGPSVSKSDITIAEPNNRVKFPHARDCDCDILWIEEQKINRGAWDSNPQPCLVFPRKM